MLPENEIETAIERITAMDKPTIVRALVTYRGRFPTDLTDEFLAEQDVDRLRHLLAALCLHCGVVPEVQEGTRDGTRESAEARDAA